MKTFVLTMIFWHDGHENSTRLENVKYSWPQMKKLCHFLNEKGLNVVAKLYDFSQNSWFEDGIHKSFETTEFRKTEKLNYIIKENSEFDFIVMFDCDMFFFNDDYEKVFDIFNRVENRSLTTFDAAKLHMSLEELKNENFNPYNFHWSYAYSGDKERGPLFGGMIGGLGGIYICDMKLITEAGLFNEEMKRWGGEDGDLMNRIYYLPNTKINPIRDFAPFHLPHFSDWSNPNYK